jgi:hypothetical protein
MYVIFSVVDEFVSILLLFVLLVFELLTIEEKKEQTRINEKKKELFYFLLKTLCLINDFFSSTFGCFIITFTIVIGLSFFSRIYLFLIIIILLFLIFLIKIRINNIFFRFFRTIIIIFVFLKKKVSN